jgi:hypothetical protein
VCSSDLSVWAQGLPKFVQGIVKPVEADPNKEYVLTELDGPYLIFVSSFSGPTARQDAHTLVLEFRKSFKWNAFVYEKTFLHDANKDFKQLPTKMKYVNPGRGTEYAVVVGNFPSLEDRQFGKTLIDVQKCKPASLKKPASNTNPNFKVSETPFALAFGVLNPMLPPESQRGLVDPLVVSMNKQRDYSLLRNPRHYTVQIATFTGNTTFEGNRVRKTGGLSNNIAENQNQKSKLSELEKGELAAAALCKALRERNVEAYEFHDRTTSIVTVGGFDQHVQRMPDGTAVTNPQIQQLIQQYQGRVAAGGRSYTPVTIDGIECDMQPRVIEVPKVRR